MYMQIVHMMSKMYALLPNFGIYNVILVITPILQSQVVEMEGEVTRLNSLLRQKEREVEQVSQVATKLTSERDNVADVVRQEFADRSV